MQRRGLSEKWASLQAKSEEQLHHVGCESPPVQLLYSFSNLLYGWSASPIRPYFLRISSCLAFLSTFRSSARCLISSLLRANLSSSLSGPARRFLQQQQQQQHTMMAIRMVPPRTAMAMIRASKFSQHTPQRAWDNWHTDAGGSSQLTGYSVQLLLVKHHRHLACGTHVSQFLNWAQGVGGGAVVWHRPWLTKLIHSTKAQQSTEELSVRLWVVNVDMAVKSDCL